VHVPSLVRGEEMTYWCITGWGLGLGVLKGFYVGYQHALDGMGLLWVLPLNSKEGGGALPPIVHVMIVWDPVEGIPPVAIYY